MKEALYIAPLLSRAMAALIVAMGALNGVARAEWPERAITIIVPFGSGGDTDTLARLLATELSFKLGQKVITENRVGADAAVGLRAGSRAAANGYTLTLTSNAVLIKTSMSESGLDPLTDFEPIAYLGAAPNVIVTGAGSGIANLPDLIVQAKAKPHELSYASPGLGTSSQLTFELLKQHAKIDVRHIPFDGSGRALTAVISGATDIAALSTIKIVGALRSGEIRALVQTGPKRWAKLPDVPTVVELGFPRAVLESTQMLFAPRGTPTEIIHRLSRATEAIFQQSDIKAKMLETGFVVQYEAPDRLRRRMMREILVWKAIIDNAALDAKR